MYELCRFLSETSRGEVLATLQERRVSVTPDQVQIMLLDFWCHPDLVSGELPSRTETFQQLACVLEDNDPRLNRPFEPSNTHWKNWPGGGALLDASSRFFNLECRTPR